MIDKENVIKGLEQFRSDFKPFCGNGADWKKVDDAIELLKEYKRKEECPCTHCMEWECDDVCDEYNKWKDT